MPGIPPVKVVFDDGREIEVRPKARDVAIAERDYNLNEDSGRFRAMYATTLAALSRAKRAGEFDGDLPESVDGLMDVADVDVIVDEADPEGKGSDPAPTTG
jgi:hypothetical protein